MGLWRLMLVILAARVDGSTSSVAETPSAFDAARWLDGECGSSASTPRGRRGLILVVTRFMQGQGHISALVGARLEQMLAVTVPSMVAQADQCYLWLVATDSELPSEPRQRLEAALAPLRHARLVDSEKALIPGTPRTLALFEKSFAGLGPRLRAIREVTSIMLDSDDGLHRNYTDFVARWRSRSPSLSEDKTFDYACASRSMEWTSSRVEQLTSRKGTFDYAKHSIHFQHEPRGCVISGLAHTKAIEGGVLRKCAPDPCGPRTHLESVHLSLRDYYDAEDVAIAGAGAPLFRVRSITSNSAIGGALGHYRKRTRRPEEAGAASSKRIAAAFGIESDALLSLARYLEGHETDVAKEMVSDPAALGCNKAYLFGAREAFPSPLSSRTEQVCRWPQLREPRRPKEIEADCRRAWRAALPGAGGRGQGCRWARQAPSSHDSVRSDFFTGWRGGGRRPWRARPRARRGRRRPGP